MSFENVFITGATGYIGGEALYQLLNNKEGRKFNITALVRNEAKSEKLLKATNHQVSTVIGTLDDTELFKEQILKNDVIINTADVDNVPHAQVLHDTLIKIDRPTILIHTSGTSVIGDDLSADKNATTKIYSDVKDIDEINKLPEKQPHRPVDKLVLDIEEHNPKVKTVIISPSTIFGLSDGYDKITSIQIPMLINACLKRGKAFSVYNGNYIWSHVHIKDLGDLYYLLLSKLTTGDKSLPTGKKGYYFGAYTLKDEGSVTTRASAIEHTWAEVSKVVAQELKERNLIESDEVSHADPEDVVKYTSFDFGPYLWGTNARSRADNAYAIGWKPKYSDPNSFWGSIGPDVDHVVKSG
ncbi:NAD(P)-binding protein [Hyphopichia burtonii NRRL Y-1933]|uniref:NAD(P)-binding protein n=1 Tax=Hyphopichia burtonii NRRL Y-1933 TaxID=984485 RepID=A0A1E4RJK4_9ASCO|nr:NAD(P)-binding protein [Hyphopichia burtonii NRRL Y-1933]ODV67410.1 NAD(P)-binding protein [Hyphopichia burtonii NRRL Y-1933]